VSPFKSRSRVYWFRPIRLPPRLLRALFDLDVDLLGTGGVSALSFPFCREAARAFEGDIDGDGGGESKSVVSLILTGLQAVLVDSPSPRLRSDRALRLLAASARAASCCSFAFSRASRSLLFFAAAPRSDCLLFDAVRDVPSSVPGGEPLRWDSEETDPVRCLFKTCFELWMC
jgi:hypothetical protein